MVIYVQSAKNTLRGDDLANGCRRSREKRPPWRDHKEAPRQETGKFEKPVILLLGVDLPEPSGR